MNVITFSNPNQLPKNYSFIPQQGDTPEQAEAAYHKRMPHYDPGIAYWHTTTKTLLIPAAYEGNHDNG